MASSTSTDSSLVGAPSALIRDLRSALNDSALPLSRRYRALFGLKHHACLSPPSTNSQFAIEAIASAFGSSSALLKHEVAYCLGQTHNLATAPYLRSVLEDANEDPMVRHESAEALGALGDVDSLQILRERSFDVCEDIVVRQTCEIAIGRIEWEMNDGPLNDTLQSSDFKAVDPAPPLSKAKRNTDITVLQATLLNTTLPLFERYRAMFTLRNLASPPMLATAVPAIKALASGFADPSALFRHEIAFVFGQLSHPASIPALVSTLQNRKEAGMVRHEAAEALGGLGQYDGVEEVLKGFLDDEEEVVRESIIVALDMAEFEKSGEIEYATLLDQDGVGTVSSKFAGLVQG